MVVIVLVAVAIVVIAVINKKNTTISKSDSFEKKIDLDKPTTSTIHFSDDFKSGDPVTTTDKNHTITTILMSKDDSFVWVCPTCETENPSSKKKCCVCYSMK